MSLLTATTEMDATGSDPIELDAPGSDPAVAAPFSVEIGGVLRHLRSAVADLIKSLPVRIRTTRDLQKAFGIDVKLCWQALKLAGPGDPLTLVSYVPTAGPMRRLLAAAANAGVAAGRVDRVAVAYAAFEEQVAVHAGDRATFAAMASNSADPAARATDDLQKAAVRLRKSAFQTASHYAGTQLDTYLGMSFVHPAASGRTAPDGSPLLDGAFLRVKLGIRRLRPSADLNVDSTRLVASDATDANADPVPGRLRTAPLDPAAAARYGATVLPRFSTDPLPPLHTATDAHGTAWTRIVGDAVGQRNAVNLVFGTAVTDAPLTALYDGRRHGFATSLDLTGPTGVVILDKLIHRPTFPRIDLDFAVQWMYAPAVPGPGPTPPLPFAERLTRLDAGLDGARTREVPDYTDLVDYVCDRCGWRPADFDVYRVRIEYPLQFTRLWTKFVPLAPLPA